MSSTTLSAAAAAAVLVVTTAGQALAAKETAIYTFAGGNDGGFPHGGVVADATGAFYGTTTSGGSGHPGVVYKLTPPAAGKKRWTQSTLYAFTGGNDGQLPEAAVLLDSASGALFGTTYQGGSAGNGVVFKLTPPAAGQTAWTQSVLWTFSGGNDGSQPSGALIEDASGNLYGTTTAGGTGVVGTVFELSPPAAGQTAWTETVLYNFTGNNDGGQPFGSVLLGGDGSLYGTTAGYGQYNYGVVYRLSPPKKSGGKWGFHLVHAFKGGADGEVPRDGLIADSSGALYGATAGFDNSLGTVFKLTPGSGDKWTQKVLYSVTGQGFEGNGPWQTVAMDSAGALYAATYGTGTSTFGEVFKLTPPAGGGAKWRARVLHTFTGGAKSEYPYTNVLIGSDGTLYGTTYGTAGQAGFFPGTVWKITQ